VSPEEAVRDAFGGAPAEKRTDYLDEAQAAEITRLAGSAPASRIVISFHRTQDGRTLGTAYLETHIVRTLPESILVVLDPQGRVTRVEILSFDEPDQYRPKPKWMDQFAGRALEPELSLSKGIRGVTGATLSSRAITAAVRRVLATHQVLSGTARSPSASPTQKAAPAPGSPESPARPAAPAAPPATPGAPRSSPSKDGRP